MWRTLLSLVLSLAAVAWATLAAVVVYGFGVGLWEQLFGSTGGVIAAGAAFLLALLAARLISRQADRLLGVEAEGAAGFAGATENGAPRDRAADDWRAERSMLFHNKRWAHYRRTRQFERLEELEQSTRE